MKNIQQTPYGFNQDKINNINIPYETLWFNKIKLKIILLIQIIQ